jgi:hypothetical protein
MVSVWIFIGKPEAGKSIGSCERISSTKPPHALAE